VAATQKAALLFVFTLTFLILRSPHQQKGFALPTPTGNYSLGRENLTVIDFARSKRPVRIDLWYPADDSTQPSGLYFPILKALLENSSTATAVKSRFGPSLPMLLAGEFRSNSQEGVNISRKGGPFPLVIFLPGLGNSPYDYSMQLEDLASHGYFVAAIEPVQDSLAVVLPDGKVVPFDSDLWSHYTEASSAETVQFYEQRALLWAEDLRFALDRLAQLTQERSSPFYGAIDVGRLGAFGHSHGGRAAATACLLEKRITACLNEDGRLDEDQLQRPYWPMKGHRINGAFAMLDWFDPGLDEADLAGMHTSLAQYAIKRLEAAGAALSSYREVEGRSYHLSILKPGMRHSDFTDLPWLTAYSAESRARHIQNLQLVRKTLVAFFDSALKQQSSFLKNCNTTYDDLLIQCYSQGHGQ
jgi:dienelactone hydrolase